MTPQPTLFDAPAGRVRRSDPITSVLAARSADRGVPARVLEVMRSEPQHAWTADELWSRVGGRQDTLRGAVSGLAKRGLIVSPSVGVSACGRRMQQWRLT